MIRNMHRISGRRLSFQPSLLEQRCPTNSFSTAVSTNPVNSGSFLKTSETNPTNLNERHLGRFYSLSDDLYKKLYDHGRYHGFPVYFREQSQTFREQCILVRKPFLDLKKCVEAVDLQKPVVRFVIYGNPGSGRSMTLGSMVHYGYVNEYVIVHLPWLPLWSVYTKEIVHSTIRQGFFDHTVDAVQWLTKFKTQNSELLEKLNLTTEKEYQWSKREITSIGSPLLEIIDHGIARPAHAVECMSALFQELKDKSSQQKCKTMVLVDGVNNLFYDRNLIKHPTVKRGVIPTSQITANLIMKELLKANWSGGVIITVVDKMAAPPEHRESDFPRYLLLKEGWETLDPFVPIEVANYSSQEIQTTIDYFLERKWLGHPAAATEEGRLELEVLSARNPNTLIEICKSR